MTYQRKRHLGVVTAALIGAMLMLLWLTPQVHSQESTGGAENENKPQLPEAQKKDLAERMAKLTRDNEEALPPEHRVDKDPEGNPYVAGELNVAYKAGVSDAAKKETLQKVKAQKSKELSQINSQTLSFPEVKNEQAQEARQKALERKKQALEQNPNVEAVSYNYFVKAATTPNDPSFWRQWGLTAIQAPQAWDTERGDWTYIAVIDTGVQNNHPDLINDAGVSAVVREWDYVEDDAVAQDPDGHGTHVAGIAGAYTNNARGIAATSPGAWTFDLRTLPRDGWGNNADVADAIVDARDLGAHVINLSLGGWFPDPTLERAVNYAWNNGNGSVVVAAAGNDNERNVGYPAAFDNAIAVGAIDSQKTRAWFSNYGPQIDVVAPGVSIYSTVPRSADWNGDEKPDNLDYNYSNGTSMSTPFVSGVASLLASGDSPSAPRLSARTIRERIESTASDLGASGWDQEYGAGLVNAYHAINDSQTGVLVADKWVYIPEGTARVDTGIVVKRGARLRIWATPEERIWSGVAFTGQNGPEGWNDVDCAVKFPLRCSYPYSLIGQAVHLAGFDSRYFYVGRYYNKVSDEPYYPAKLYLRVNDDAPGNGSGRFYAHIRVYE